jgi:hypothetical protein
MKVTKKMLKNQDLEVMVIIQLENHRRNQIYKKRMKK